MAEFPSPKSQLYEVIVPEEIVEFPPLNEKLLPDKHWFPIGSITAVNNVPDAMVVEAVSAHPLSSNTATLYVPEHCKACVGTLPSPGDGEYQLYPYEPDPPVPDALNVPRQSPAQVSLVDVAVATTAVGSVKTIVSVAVHPLPSVAITLCTPGATLLCEAPAPIKFQLYV